MAEHVMMKLQNSKRGFKFSIHTATYQSLTKTLGWVWSSSKRFGQYDSLQFNGPENPTMTLPGTVYPEFNNVGVDQLKVLESLGNDAEPILIISGVGDVLGYWVMTSFTETEARHMVAGIPTKQTFNLELKYYGKTLQN